MPPPPPRRKSINKDVAKVAKVPSDLSLHPSYSRIKLDYSVVCRERSEAANARYDRQFMHELERQEAMQSCAYDAMRFHRHFVITTLWPPLHTRKEIKNVLDCMFNMNLKQKRRLNFLVEQPQN